MLYCRSELRKSFNCSIGCNLIRNSHQPRVRHTMKSSHKPTIVPKYVTYIHALQYACPCDHCALACISLVPSFVMWLTDYGMQFSYILHSPMYSLYFVRYMPTSQCSSHLSIFTIIHRIIFLQFHNFNFSVFKTQFIVAYAHNFCASVLILHFMLDVQISLIHGMRLWFPPFL